MPRHGRRHRLPPEGGGARHRYLPAPDRPPAPGGDRHRPLLHLHRHPHRQDLRPAAGRADHARPPRRAGIAGPLERSTTDQPKKSPPGLPAGALRTNRPAGSHHVLPRKCNRRPPDGRMDMLAVLTARNELSRLADARLFREQAYVGGRWTAARNGRVIDVTNPATGERLGVVPALGPAETEAAIAAAAEAFPAWRRKL